MTDVQHELVDLIRYIVTGTPHKQIIANPEEVFALARKHDMAHFIGYSVDEGKIVIPDIMIKKAFRQQYFMAERRVIILENEIKNIKDAFEESGVDFIPLKGAVIRKLYPEQWMRVSADIDILVRMDELEKAEQVLVEKLEYRVTSKGAHHNHVTAPSGFHVDLHFTLSEREGKAKPILDDVWNRCSVIEGKKHEYRMEDDMFYLFHMFHAATHFQLGGRGIRPVLDTWLLNHMIEFDQKKRHSLLQQAGYLHFAEIFEQMAEAWFSGIDISGYEDIENYIFVCGLYGGKQRIAAAQAQHTSRIKYLIKRAFPPVDKMKYAGYPVVEKWRVMLPICWILRLVRGLVQGKGRMVLYEFQKTKKETKKSAEIAELFRKLELS